MARDIIAIGIASNAQAGGGVTESAISNALGYKPVSQSDVSKAINDSGHLKRIIVDTLPSVDEADKDTIYMIKIDSIVGDDKYQEYMLINNELVLIGDTSVDLTDYAKTSDVDAKLDTKFDKVEGENLSAGISELKSDLNNIAIINNVVSDNLIDISKNTVGYQLNTSGKPIVNENYTISDYIAINPETQYWVGRIYNEKVYHGAIQRTCFYTSDKQFISYIGDSGYTDGIITTPANAMYIRLAFYNSTYSDNTMMIIENNAPDGYVEYFPPFKSIEIKSDILPYSDILDRVNIEEIKKHPLYGKKVTWYGDSIIKNTWWQPISELFNMTSTNCGVGGTTICGTATVSSACMNLQSRMLGDYGNIVDENNGAITYDGVAIPLDADFIIIGGGTNDWAQNKALGEKALPITDESSEITPTTFYYACHEMFKNIGLLFPNARVIVLGAPFGKHNNREQFTNKYGIVNNQGLTSIDYGNALCDIAEQWGHIALRYGNGMGINVSNVETLLDPTLQGHLHPTTETAQKLFVNATLNGLLNIRY